MVFLNDVDEGGELAFPVADNEIFTWEVSKFSVETITEKVLLDSFHFSSLKKGHNLDKVKTTLNQYQKAH